jgi:hypothetical protein
LSGASGNDELAAMQAAGEVLPVVGEEFGFEPGAGEEAIVRAAELTVEDLVGEVAE